MDLIVVLIVAWFIALVQARQYCNLTERDFPNHTVNYLTHKIRDVHCYDSHNRPHLRQSAYTISKMWSTGHNNDISTVLRDEKGPLPSRIKVALYVADLDSISEISLDYKVDLYLQMHWIDMRLNHKNNESQHLWPGLIDEIWIPDLFFVNAKEAYTHKVLMESRLDSMFRSSYFSDRQIQIESKGRVYVSMRVSLTLACQMNFKYYPFDWQICPLEMGSFGYSKNHLQFEFDSNGTQVIGGLRLPGHRLKGHFQRDCIKDL